MKKRFLSMILTLVLALSLAPAALAADDAEAILTAGGNITLTRDIVLARDKSSDFVISKDTVLDLNGHTINGQSDENWFNQLTVMGDGVTVTIKNGKFADCGIHVFRGSIVRIENVEVTSGSISIDETSRISVMRHVKLAGKVYPNGGSNGGIQNWGRIDLIENCTSNHGLALMPGSSVGTVRNCYFHGMVLGTMGTRAIETRGTIDVVENCVLCGYWEAVLINSGGSIGKMTNCTMIGNIIERDTLRTTLTVVSSTLPKLENCILIAEDCAAGSTVQLEDNSWEVYEVPIDLTSNTFYKLSEVNVNDYLNWTMPEYVPTPEPSLENFTNVNTYAPGQFADVAETHWGAANVRKAYELGLMQGSSDTGFDPDGSVTLAQAIALAARLSSIYESGEENFVQGDVWYQTYVDYAKRSGIPADFENYNAPATRSQFAVILAAAFPSDALKAVNTVADDAIPDVKMTDASAAAIYALYRAGVLTGNDALGTFTPETSITRAAAAAIVTRMADASLRETVTLG